MVIGHYTSLAGLLGILDSNSLHATSFDASNDHLEMTAGRAAVEKICKDIAQGFPVGFAPKDGSEFLEADEAFQDDVRQSSAENVANILFESLKQTINPFICCFSKISDDIEITKEDLSQWRAYASEDGALIKFDPDKLFSAIEKEDKFYHYAYIFEKEVSYKFDDAIEIISQHRNTIEGLFKYNELGLKDSPPQITDDFLRDFVLASAFTKAACFSSEREYRIAAAIPTLAQFKKLPKRNQKKRNQLKSKISQNNIVPYIEILKDSIIPCIDSILIGPSSNRDHNRAMMEKIISFNGYTFGVEVSSLPYKGSR